MIGNNIIIREVETIKQVISMIFVLHFANSLFFLVFVTAVYWRHFPLAP